MTIADRLAVLDQGVIQQVGTPRELYDTPANRFVAEFVGSINIYAGRIASGADDDDGTCAVTIDGLGRARVPLAPHCRSRQGRRMRWPSRSGRMRCGSQERGADDGLVFDAQIGTTEFLGEFVRHELTVGPLCVVADLPHARFAEALAPGVRSRFAVSAAEIVVLADPPH